MIDIIEKNNTDLSLLNGEFYRHIQEHGLLNEIPLRKMATTDFMRNYKEKINSWPCFVSPEMVASMQEMNASILTVMYKALHAIFSGDSMKMASAMDMNPACTSFFFNGMNLSDVCFRTDAVLTDEGLKVLEVNIGTDIGGWEVKWMDETFRQVDGYRGFFERHTVNCRNTPLIFFKFLIDSACKISRGATNLILIKVAPGIDTAIFGDVLQEIMETAIREAAVDCEIRFYSTFDELQVTREGVFHRGRRAYAMTFGELSDEPQGPSVELFRSIFAGRIACPDFPAPHLLSDKRNLALVHYAAENGLLSEEDAAMVRRHVPKTFILGGPLSSQTIRNEVIANKDAYVVKQCRGMQGADVHVGLFKSDLEWREIITGLHKPELWIAQAYCESKKFYGQAGHSRDVFDFIWGLFQFGNRFGGSWVRMMPVKGEKYDGVINCARGAEECIVFEAAC
jgi:hypothetical protein